MKKSILVITRRSILLAVIVAYCQLGFTQDSDVIDRYFVNDPSSKKYAVILVGPTVGDENKLRFRQWAFSLHDILGRDYGYSSQSIVLLHNNGENLGPGYERVDGATTKEGITEAFHTLSSKVGPGDQVTVFLIGHGSGAEEEAKFNIVGPDMTGDQFAELLDQFQQQNIVVVNSTSASYGFSAALSGEGRVVISATRSPSEKFDPIFSKYFIEALDGRNGDRDKNNRVSMLEAFNYAKASVDLWYEEQGRLASEHAGLDDNGDALFSLNPVVADPDGRLAEIAYIDSLADDSANLSSAALTLKSRMQDIERAIFILRGRKAEFIEADYWEQMEVLLLDLAKTTGQFNEQTQR